MRFREALISVLLFYGCIPPEPALPQMRKFIAVYDSDAIIRSLETVNASEDTLDFLTFYAFPDGQMISNDPRLSSNDYLFIPADTSISEPDSVVIRRYIKGSPYKLSVFTLKRKGEDDYDVMDSRGRGKKHKGDIKSFMKGKYKCKSKDEIKEKQKEERRKRKKKRKRKG